MKLVRESVFIYVEGGPDGRNINFIPYILHRIRYAIYDIFCMVRDLKRRIQQLPCSRPDIVFQVVLLMIRYHAYVSLAS